MLSACLLQRVISTDSNTAAGWCAPSQPIQASQQVPTAAGTRVASLQQLLCVQAAWAESCYAHNAILEPSGLSTGLLKKSCPVTSCVTAPLVRSAATTVAAAAAAHHDMRQVALSGA
jgi:hypothetical protein